MKDKRRKLIVVLGMHRSGTSALTRGLKVLGVEMGDHLIPGQEGRNDKGYWEDEDINAFNERLLAHLGSSWHGLAYFDEARLIAPELDELRSEAKALLKDKVAGRTTFGFKDPRTSILLPFWREVFKQLKLDDAYVLVVRNPLDVAASLEKRDGMPSIEANLLWAKYTISALRYSKGSRRALVHYDELLRDPEGQLKMINDSLGIRAKYEHTDELQVYVGDFLAKDLRHSKSSQAALKRSQDTPSFVRVAYDCLQMVVRRKLKLDSADFRKKWSSVERDYLIAEQLYAHIDTLKACNEVSRRDAVQARNERAELQEALRQARSTADRVSSENDAALAERDMAVNEKERLQVERNEAVNDRDRALSELGYIKAEKEQVIQSRGALNLQKQQAEKQLLDVRQELQMAREKLRSVEEDRARKEAAHNNTQRERDQALSTRDEAFGQRDEALHARDEVMSERDQALSARDDAFGQRDQALHARDEVMSERDQALTARDEAFGQRDQALHARDEAVSERDQALTARDEAFGQRDQALHARDEAVSEKDQALTARDEAFGQRDQALAACDEAVSGRNEAYALRDEALGERDEALAAYNQALSDRAQACSVRDQSINERNLAQAARDEAVSSREQILNRFEKSVRSQEQLQQEVQSLDRRLSNEVSYVERQRRELEQIYSSRSWRLTSPLRAARRTLVTSPSPYWLLRRLCSDSARTIWHALPGNIDRKKQVKETLFLAMPTFLGWTRAYRSWLDFQNHHARLAYIADSEKKKVVKKADDSRNESMTLSESDTTEQYTARLIALYLPQFHPIPENDLWWGKGFTEWTNTAKAKPLFPGHQIPSVPSDLGYYDLRVAESRIAQAELAREYGIEGFCYWHYWFGNGRRLLDRPFEEVLASGEPDFPFCLAWANHTWSGIWHGSPDKILIEQTYPGIDDIRAHFYALLDAFRDHRYLKVDGRNIFSVYRPSDLKDAKLFIDTWRELAEKEGAPGFYFVAITDYPWQRPDDGYDAFTTNPPVGMLPYQGIEPMNDELVATLAEGEDAAGLPQVYAYETFIENAFPDVTRQKDFHPCVVPNWDNTPRSGSNGFALHGSTPELYARHLREAVGLVEDRDPDQRVIFVKSWNEWAETNYLEPDVRWGRAYLERTFKTISTKKERVT